MNTSIFAQDDACLDDEALQRTARVAIERMSREGRSQAEIGREVASIMGTAPAGPAASLRGLIGRLRPLVQSSN